MSDPDEELPGPLDPDDEPSPTQPGGAILIGPVLGVIIGYVVFQLLPEDTSIFVGLGIALVVITLTTYITIEISRRRARRELGTLGGRTAPSERAKSREQRFPTASPCHLTMRQPGVVMNGCIEERGTS